MWLSSNYSFLLIICCIKEQNKFCCIIISYCELKLIKVNIVFVLKIRKEEKLPGKMMLLHGKNDNIIVLPILLGCTPI